VPEKAQPFWAAEGGADAPGGKGTRHECEWVDQAGGTLCGTPALDFVIMDPGGEIGHKWWLCAEHFDEWTAPQSPWCWKDETAAGARPGGEAAVMTKERVWISFDPFKGKLRITDSNRTLWGPTDKREALVARFNVWRGKYGLAPLPDPDPPKNLYCVLIPTHRNPNGRWSDFKWQRKFSRGHDEAILANVAAMHGGYTMIPSSEGCWWSPQDGFQIEGMRPFLFTAETQEKANIIADLVCKHYDQKTVTTYVMGQNVQFRDEREMVEFFTNMLSPKWVRRLRAEFSGK
jgi:hypothetical protein